MENESFKFQESICRDVPVETCEQVPFTKCSEVPKEYCEDISFEECKQSPEEVCWNVPGEVCTNEQKEMCDFYPGEKCSSVPQTTCHQTGKLECSQHCTDSLWCKVCGPTNHNQHQSLQIYLTIQIICSKLHKENWFLPLDFCHNLYSEQKLSTY